MLARDVARIERAPRKRHVCRAGLAGRGKALAHSTERPTLASLSTRDEVSGRIVTGVR